MKNSQEKSVEGMSDTTDPQNLLKPLCTAWLAKIRMAEQKKYKEFGQYADQCMAFFSGAVGFMYEPEFQRKYFAGTLSPKFKITLNRAFELVALFGPLLYNRNPDRRVTPHKWPAFDPRLVAADMGVDLDVLAERAQAAQQAIEQAWQQARQNGVDPNTVSPPTEAMQVVRQYEQISQYIEQLGQADTLERLQRDALCQVVEQYQAYTPYEQPGGGLEQAAEDAITEALIKGRGLLVPRTYQMPGSKMRLTGCFFKSVDDLLIDPDARSAEFGEAWWVALRYREPHFIAERRFKLAPGALKNRGESEPSAEAMGGVQGNPRRNELMDEGETYDLCTYYDIYSIAGVGTKLTGTPQPLQASLDRVVGDFARIVVCEGVPWPLNAPGSKVLEAGADEVAKMFSWPVPYWKDRRWPFAKLDFYPEPNHAWPVSPLRPGLGELICLNVIMSHLVQRSWDSSITLIAVLKRAQKELESALKGGDSFQLVPISEANKNINEVIQYIQKPEVNFDAWRIIEHLSSMFDKRVGMSDLMYGTQDSGISRTAEDVKVRQEKISVRPDHMSKKVETWLSDVSRLEMICAHQSQISADSVRPILGTVGARLWQNRFLNTPHEEILREVICRIEVGSARKPNRQKDAANLKELYQSLSQTALQYAQRTGRFSLMNALNRQLGEALEQDMGEFMFDDIEPPQEDQGQQQLGQEKAQREQQKAQREQQKAQLEQQKAEREQQKVQAAIAGKQAELQLKAAEAEQTLVQDAERHAQQLTQQQEKHRMDMLLLQAEQRLKRLAKRGDN